MHSAHALPSTMPPSVLIVEDEFLIAANLESLVEDFGFRCAGIADCRTAALALARGGPDMALVDINLADGPTGVDIGRQLARRGVTVMYVTANPRMLGSSVHGTLGVIGKPCEAEVMGRLLDYALCRRNGIERDPPGDFVAFDD